jgi:hypothetical protein
LQFTLRDSDKNQSPVTQRSNFRRPAPGYSNNNKRTTSTTRPNSSRFRYGQDTFQSRSSSNSRNNNNGRTTSRGRATTRGTGRKAEVDPAYLPQSPLLITFQLKSRFPSSLAKIPNIKI